MEHCTNLKFTKKNLSVLDGLMVKNKPYLVRNQRSAEQEIGIIRKIRGLLINSFPVESRSSGDIGLKALKKKALP